MPRIKVNLGEIESGGFAQVEPGKWRAELVDCEEQESRAGNPMLVWTWEVKEGPSEGSTIKNFTSLQDHALFGYKETVTALGVPDDYEEELDTDRLIGREAILTIGTRKDRDRNTGEEREFASVNRVDSAEGAGGKKAPAAAGRGRARAAKKDDLPF